MRPLALALMLAAAPAAAFVSPFSSSSGTVGGGGGITSIPVDAYPKTAYYNPSANAVAAPTSGRVHLMQMFVSGTNPKNYNIQFPSGTASPTGSFYVGLYGPLADGCQSAGSCTCLGAALVWGSTSQTFTAVTNNVQVTTNPSPAAVTGGRIYCLAYEGDGGPLFQRHNNTRNVLNAVQYFDQTFGALPATVPALGSANNANDFPVLMSVWGS